ncbi:hypothetical protein D9Q98_005388 [Chlorella vulgaris]|uniref:ARMET C-terminal domain-containing protein n=1 Tax=Chlorella vulgaris TaxID=3077 RepID=A0A9D4YVT4_CHLVU|nr:hypothetical protein D9Q98_005388 [Chlorella vulgaris]
MQKGAKQLRLARTPGAAAAAAVAAAGQRHPGVVKVAAVNCEQQQAVCQEHGVRGYPTTKAFRYFNDWALSLLPKHVKTARWKSTKLARFLNQFYSGKACAAAIKIDASTDLAKMRVSQLKQILESRGEQCKGCVDKSGFV